MNKIVLLVVLVALVGGAFAAATRKTAVKSSGKVSGRCRAPSVSPKRVEAVITQCQDEVKLAIIQEALDSLQDTPTAAATQRESMADKAKRVRRELFNKDEKKIAGCLLQCVYRQVKAVDQLGFPEPEGLIKLYTEGGDDEEYNTATTRAVHACLAISSRQIAERYQEPGLACDVSYDVFECVTNKVAEYCGKV